MLTRSLLAELSSTFRVWSSSLSVESSSLVDWSSSLAVSSSSFRLCSSSLLDTSSSLADSSSSLARSVVLDDRLQVLLGRLELVFELGRTLASGPQRRPPMAVSGGAVRGFPVRRRPGGVGSSKRTANSVLSRLRR